PDAGYHRAGRRGRPRGDAGGGRPPACRDPEGRRRRASPVDGSGHGEGPPHRDTVPQRLHRAQGAGDRVRHTRQCRADRHRHARREGRVAARQAPYHRPATELREGRTMNVIRNSKYQRIETHKIAGALGAEVEGVDLSRELDDETLGEIRSALLENCVIFFRDQSFTPDQQLVFARRWGEIHFHPFMEGMKSHPEILEIVKTPTDKKNFGGSWHTDQMFSPQPAMGTMLYAKQVPSAGGDTMFTNQYLAYESLSDGMKRM